MFTPNRSLYPFNTFRIEASAAWFASFDSLDILREQLAEIRKRNKPDAPLLILGGGSNILLTRNFPGFVLKNEVGGLQIIREDDAYVYVKAGAGVNWHDLVCYALEKNLGGLENLALIPGKVGASPMQNIGAYGVELKDVFLELEAVDVTSGALMTFSKADCAFGYRESIFKNKWRNRFIILSVTYRLSKNPTLHLDYGAIRQELEKMQRDPDIHSVAEAVIRIRRSKLPDPSLIGNAGSFFKNPEVDTAHFLQLKETYPGLVGYSLPGHKTKLAAGWLIEHSGPGPGQSWKGYRLQDAGCHAQQALVLVNHGKARGEEILSLSRQIMDSVMQKFGVQLVPEVNII